MNKESITKILRELYEIDPGLREHEDVLEKAVMHLMESRSGIMVDESFVRQLRSELVAKAHSLSAQTPVAHASGGFWQSFVTMSKFSYGLGGAVIIALLLVGLQQIQKQDNPLELASRTSITKVSDNAFGVLQPDQGGRGGDNASGAPTQSLTSNESGSGVSAPFAGPQPATATREAVGVDAKMIAPGLYPYYQYKYTYKGEPLTLDADTVEVLRRIRPGLSNAPAASILENLSMGLLNLGNFKNLKVQSLNLFEDRDYGYMLNFDMYEGFVSVNEYWNKWPQPYAGCSTEECFRTQQLKPSDVPADDELIRIADEFVRSLNINTANYGTPVVQDDWRVYMAAAPAAERSSIIAPDMVSVVYPLLVNGQEAYEQGGMKAGFTVNVNIRAKRASGLWGLTTQQYESSDYAAEKDAATIVKLAEQGGPNMYFPQEGNVKYIEAELGTPTKGYVRMWNYKGPNDSAELLVPALIFPITKKPAEMSYIRNIIIPLAKDLIQQNGYGGGIMPMLKTEAQAR